MPRSAFLNSLLPAFPFRLTLSLWRLRRATLTATVSSIDGFTGDLPLSCEGLPTAATCQFIQDPVTIPANGSVSTTLTVNIPAGTVAGPYTLRVVGSGSVAANPAFTVKGASLGVADATTVTDFQSLS